MMNKNIKHLALVAVVLSGLGFSQAQAASVSINAGRGGVSVVIADRNAPMHRCAPKQPRFRHDLRDRRHVDHCRFCQDELRRERARREAARRHDFRPMPHR